MAGMGEKIIEDCEMCEQPRGDIETPMLFCDCWCHDPDRPEIMDYVIPHKPEPLTPEDIRRGEEVIERAKAEMQAGTHQPLAVIKRIPFKHN